jgi:predicted RNA-binding Zn-ribbon protein involved in translation (DUF1610 family)
MERSKYISYHRGRSPRKNRARVVQGSFEDRNKYYRCWNCGFIFDIEQVSLGGERTGSYIAPPDDVVYNDIENTGDLSCVLGIDTPFNVGGLSRIDSAGDVIQPVALGAHRVSQGCPACGVTAQF